MKASHYGKGGSDRCEAPRSGDAPRCSFGRPSRTWIVRPSTILPSNAAMAGPASTSVISTKANPRDKPLVGHQFKFANRPKRLEKRADCLWCRTGIQVTHKDVLHKIPLVLRTSYARPIWHGRVPRRSSAASAQRAPYRGQLLPDCPYSPAFSDR